MTLCLLAGQAYGQGFSLGSKHSGIGFGWPEKYTGILFHPFNPVHEAHGEYNGVLIGLASRFDRMNGIAVTALGNHVNQGYGIAVGPFVSGGRSFHGISIGGVVSRVRSGLGIALVVATGDTINGVLAAAMFSAGQKGSHCYDTLVVNGVALAGLAVLANELNGLGISSVVKTRKLRGLSIGLINKAHEAHGIQIGLLNYMGNNRRWCRWLPIVNMHFRKAKPKEEVEIKQD